MSKSFNLQPLFSQRQGDIQDIFLQCRAKRQLVRFFSDVGFMAQLSTFFYHLPVAYKQDSILSVDSSDLDDFQNQRTGRVELISRLSACISFMLKCHCITSLIDCLNTLPWPHLALFIIHSTCHWPFFFPAEWLGAFILLRPRIWYYSSAVYFHFISCKKKKKNPSSATGVDLRLDVKRTNYWHLLIPLEYL